MLRFVDYDVVFQEIPGEVTLAVNLSNCPNHCEGCHSPHLWEDVGEPLTEQALDGLLRRYGSAVTCVCLMGGDADPRGVESVAQFLSSRGTKVGWYSGRASLPDGIDTRHFRYIKLGPYVAALGGLRSPHTNQRLYRVDDGHLTDITSHFWRQ